MSGNVNFPYRYITGLPPVAQQQLWENFQKLASQFPTGTQVYDVYVDPTLTADNTSTRTFRTPFKAIAYAVDTLGLSIVNVGWRATNSGSNTATETANYAGAGSPTWATITVIGDASGTAIAGRGAAAQPVWALSTFTDASKITKIGLTGVRVTVGANSSTPPVGATQMIARGCFFQGVSGSSTTGFALPGGVYLDCGFNQCTFVNDSGGHILQDCSWSSQTLTTVTIGSSDKFYAYNCRFQGGGGVLCTWNVSNTVFMSVGSSWVADNPSGSTIALSYTGGGLFTMDAVPNLGFGFASGTLLALTVAAGTTDVVISGSFRTLTVGSCNNVVINATVHGVCDITGPATLSLQSSVTGNTLRGTGLTGTVEVTYSSGTALSFVSVINSTLLVAFKGSGTGKAYAIDVGSGPGVMVETGESSGSTASTNASTTFLVINQTGTTPSGSAGPWFAGTYPSPRWGPDFTEAFVVPPPLDAMKLRHITIAATKPTSGQVLGYNATTKMLEWVTNSAVDATAIHSGDSAGPWMAGTFPSPRPGPDFTQQFLLAL